MKWTKTLFLMLCLTACSGEDNIYREYACSFTFDTSLHPQPCHLTAILGNNGHFCKIETSMVQGLRQLKTTRNFDNATETVRLTTQQETQLRYELGANNCIIVGTSSYDNRLIAYDGQCANCLKDYGGTNFPLTWQNSGTQLYCAKCKRSYDVNNGVVASGTSGRELYRYMSSFDGVILRVWN
ncbi:MAG: hypothetical protein IJ159_04340 [Prevotella sp.]|nr:hypothetical protein [Prevotella sp.]